MLRSSPRRTLQSGEGSVSTDVPGDSLEVASIDALPQELLCAIFSLLYDDHDRRLSASIILSHVCRRWRELVLDLPRLWTDVRIAAYAPEVLEDILLRSKGRALSICLYLPEPIRESATFALWKTVIMLAPEMKRCRSLHISAFKSVYKLIFNAFGYEVDAPLLRHLKLHCRDAKSSDKECLLMRSVVFKHSFLTHVDLDGVAIPSAIDLSRVRTMNLRNVNFSAPGNFFSDNALERLRLSSTTIPWGHEMVAPRLAHLTLDRQLPVPFCNAQWTTPALTSLTISRPSRVELYHLERCLRDPFALRLFANLTNLTLAHCDTELMAKLVGICALMQATPELRRLNFDGARPEPILEGSRGYSAGWPHLVDIYVGGVRFNGQGTGASTV
ncbi:hypothetical protein LshimejAT787_0311580 [Lyophyllum shimeji]|uniref:F-box domain-containing protein n=1 Tax=Lyophyllum shimeji TaxID=47721 RepID=A0A9P3PK50_LYOSH|nr:hypothetical protein LshimejAT787_0311580 [Lyophyllum shimeji]